MENMKLLTAHVPNHSHAWHGTWNRPMLVDEDEMHPFTVARMTDHNVRGSDPEVPAKDIDALRHPEEQIVHPF